MPYRLQLDGHDIEVQILACRPLLRVRIGTVQHSAAVAPAAADEFSLTVDGVSYQGWRCTVGDEVHVRLDGRTYIARVVRRGTTGGSTGAEDEIRASMPGVVVGVHCKPGQTVGAGDRLLTLESMKLQMTIVASRAATVQTVHVAAETVFERGALLVSLAPPEEREP
jgi:3-methylcrotonyl-CoA carboxylase alpha subunit